MAFFGGGVITEGFPEGASVPGLTIWGDEISSTKGSLTSAPEGRVQTESPVVYTLLLISL